jgi:ribosomal protein S12 methylthiotransferase
VIVAGCLPQRERAELRERFPGVDAVIGVDQLRRIGAVVRALARGREGIVDVTDEPGRLFEPGAKPVVFSGGPYAFLKIAEGCDHLCAFCAIPGIRGRYRSRPPANVLKEAETLLGAGYRELNLISQDITAYGLDLGGAATLPALLRALGRIGGRFWVRLLYGFPVRVTGELLETMAAVPQVCPYLDVPIQHSHPDILRAMRRADTIQPVSTLAGRARAAMPDVALRTTCLLGYPGETEAHVRHLLRFVRETAFDHLGAFVFSPEAGTPAGSMPGRPPRAVAEARRERLLRVQQRVVARKLTGQVGREVQVLLERSVAGRDTVWTARTPFQAPEVDGVVTVDGVPSDAAPGTFGRVRLTGASGYDLAGAWLRAD